MTKRFKLAKNAYGILMRTDARSSSADRHSRCNDHDVETFKLARVHTAINHDNGRERFNLPWRAREIGDHGNWTIWWIQDRSGHWKNECIWRIQRSVSRKTGIRSTQILSVTRLSTNELIHGAPELLAIHIEPTRYAQCGWCRKRNGFLVDSKQRFCVSRTRGIDVTA